MFLPSSEPTFKRVRTEELKAFSSENLSRYLVLEGSLCIGKCGQGTLALCNLYRDVSRIGSAAGQLARCSSIHGGCAGRGSKSYAQPRRIDV